MKREAIIGTYVLESFILDKPDSGKQPWGKNMHGLLIYASSGHMSVSINKDVEQSDDGEAQDTFDSILFYSGTFEMSEKEIIHNVTEASDPSRIGKTLVRYPHFEDTLLELAGPQESWGRAVLCWRKFG